MLSCTLHLSSEQEAVVFETCMLKYKHKIKKFYFFKISWDESLLPLEWKREKFQLSGKFKTIDFFNTNFN